MLETLIGSLRYTFRIIAKQPQIHVSAALSLALSMGATIAAFSVMNAVVFARLQIPLPEALIQLVASGAGARSARQESFPATLRLTLQRSGEGLCDTFSIGYPSETLISEENGKVQHVQVEGISGNGFTVLGVYPVKGRLLDRTDGRKGAAPVALISEGFWRGRLSSDLSVLGRTLRLAGGAYQVVGIVGGGFYGVDVGAAPDIWIPTTDDQGGRVFARLRPGVQPAALLSRLQRTSTIT